MAVRGKKISSPISISIFEYARMAFGTGLGFFASLIVYIFIAMVFFIPGFILVLREHNKPKEKRNNVLLGIGYVLMIFGVIIGMGMGSDILFSDLSEEF